MLRAFADSSSDGGNSSEVEEEENQAKGESGVDEGVGEGDKGKYTAKQSRFSYAQARKHFRGTESEWRHSQERSDELKKMPASELARRIVCQLFQFTKCTRALFLDPPVPKTYLFIYIYIFI